MAGIVLLSIPAGFPKYLEPLAAILKYVRPSVGKSPIFHADMSACKLNWQYDRVSTSAAYQVLKLTREANRICPSVTAPVLLIHSKKDSVAKHKGAQDIYDRIGSSDKHLVLLEESGHVLSVDCQWIAVAERISEFVEAHMSHS